MVEFAVISVGRNCARFIPAWFESLDIQTHVQWKCYAALDISEDGSRELMQWVTHNDKRFNLQLNETRQGCMKNTFDCIKKAEDETVIVCVDLDDRLNGLHVLAKVAEVYEKTNCWLTYGSYAASNGKDAYWCREIPDKVWRENSHRKNAWSASVLRTFKKKLFDKINPKDLLLSNENWPMRATDRYFMYPMLEMAGKERVVFIREKLYYVNVYGQQQPEDKVERESLKWILSKKPYSRLNAL